MELTVENTFAAPVIPGVEDKFYYVISEDCVMCASCAEACPVQVKCPERSEPLGFGHLRVFLIYHVLPALVSGIYYEHEADQHYRNPYIHLVPF